MAQASSTDFRRASEPELLDAIRSGAPLALAEAYHRSVPAAHAVARRLMPDSGEVEDVLLSVYTSLWTGAPDGLPLEGWIRRTTWAAAAERLRAAGRAPASPSASGLLPDLPAPDVRFIDAAERAIADLSDDQRRALLLAHDKGVPTTAQDDGADTALVAALLSLAGPETSSGDRQALEADACTDLRGLGDWCLGIGDASMMAAVEAAIDERGGCAARSRAVRRGRRRIEGLPATPDMGQRVLVTVLTTAGRVSAAPVPGATSGGQPDDVAPAVGVAPSASETGGPGSPQDEVEITTAASEASADVSPFAPTSTASAARTDEPADPDDPFADLDDPFTDLAEETPTATAESGVQSSSLADAVGDTADLPAMAEPELPAASAASPEAATGDWTPMPGDTAELRLSDILAEGHDDDDPFAALESEDEPASTSAGPANPYAALSDLDEPGTGPSPFPADAPSPFQADATATLPPQRFDDADTDVYVEGDPHYEDELPQPRASRGGLAAVLAWILPILGGLAVGILLAVQVFGPPSTS